MNHNKINRNHQNNHLTKFKRTENSIKKLNLTDQDAAASPELEAAPKKVNKVKNLNYRKWFHHKAVLRWWILRQKFVHQHSQSI
jgi:hypothetical protein